MNGSDASADVSSIFGCNTNQGSRGGRGDLEHRRLDALTAGRPLTLAAIAVGASSAAAGTARVRNTDD
jgi:hypothetical protein